MFLIFKPLLIDFQVHMEHPYMEVGFWEAHRSVFMLCVSLWCGTIQDCRPWHNQGRIMPFMKALWTKVLITLVLPFPWTWSHSSNTSCKGNLRAHFLLLNTLSEIPEHNKSWNVLATNIIIEITRKGENVDNYQNCLNMSVTGKSFFLVQKVQS